MKRARLSVLRETAVHLARAADLHAEVCSVSSVMFVNGSIGSHVPIRSNTTTVVLDHCQPCTVAFKPICVFLTCVLLRQAHITAVKIWFVICLKGATPTTLKPQALRMIRSNPRCPHCGDRSVDGNQQSGHMHLQRCSCPLQGRVNVRRTLLAMAAAGVAGGTTQPASSAPKYTKKVQDILSYIDKHPLSPQKSLPMVR